MAKEKPVKAVKTKRSTSGKLQDKKGLAQILFTRNNLDRKEVARRVGVNPKTIAKWVDDGKWEAMRKSLLVTREEQLRNLLDQLSELNAHIKEKPEGQRYASSAEADTQGKITSSIKKLTTDAGLTEVMEVCTLLIGHIQNNFPEKMNDTIPVLDSFVKKYL